MKILILSHTSDLGGAERSMLDLFDYWAKVKNIEPYFIVRLPHMALVKELKKRGWGFTSLRYDYWAKRNPSSKEYDRWVSAKDNARTTKKIEALIQRLKPDVVMTNTLVTPWAALAARSRGIPHVWFVREYGDSDHELVFEQGVSRTFSDIGGLSGLVVANSKTLARHIAKFVPAAKVVTLYNPFDIAKLKKTAAQKASNPFKDKKSLKVVVTGRISPTKGQDLVAEAVGILKREGYDVELCVIGDPDLTSDGDSLRKVIERYGIGGLVHMVGKQKYPLAIAANADIAITPSQAEAFGRTTFESMAIGLPVIGSNSGATPELVTHGKNGLLFEPGNAKSLASQLKVYAQDRRLIAKHGEQASLKARAMLQGPNNADALFEKIEKILENPPRATQEINYAVKRYPRPRAPLTLKSRELLKRTYFVANRLTGFTIKKKR